MSKMKNLFRKRRTIIPDHHQSPPNLLQNPPANSSPSPVNSLSPNSPSSSSSAMSVGVGPSGSGGSDFNRFEEEYQVQLALALSASDPDGVEDLDLVQMKAAKRMSLVSSATAEAGIVSSGGGSDSGDDRKMEFLSLRYWSYNVVNYDEKLMDGFYDVYGVISSPNSSQEKMPSLVDLQGITVSDNIGYEVVLVNHNIDFSLQELETRVASIALECKAAEHGPISSGLVQKIADIVVERMGGPVGDTELMLRRWTSKGYELRTSLNTIILPLGLLDVGLSRHRALLFKVLADSVNLPCKLLKGSNYTGTDEGAVNVIKVGNDSEYIVDLMGAPGALIPAEVPSTHIQNSSINSNTEEPADQSAKDLTDDQSAKDLCVAFDNINSQFEIKSHVSIGSSPGNISASKIPCLQCDEESRASGEHRNREENQTLNSENRTILLPTQDKLRAGVSHSSDAISPAQQMKVNDVSKYVVTAAKNPEFAQKLHAVLLESGASPPLDLFSDLNLYQDPIKRNAFGNTYMERCGGKKDEQSSSKEAESSIYTNQRIILGVQSSNESSVNDSCDNTDSLLDGVAGWEIPWEDLQIGERIGLGSYGEVYRADWNGTEVAVKRLLDQSLSGDALDQFRCEVKIMLRLRHPNVVLFMGAVTRPPNLSILTEFLPRGSLYRLLHRPNIKIDERRRLRMALDVAKGMNYLHTSHPTIVHRDLKSPNLLVDKNWVVKVCDFGLSRLKQNTFLSSKSTAGTPEWMAPEVLQNEPSDEKCDVYSFGVILWELATMRMPWSGMNPMQVVGAVGFQNRRLDIPKEIDPMVAKIITDCWESEPSQRPSFAQLMSPLKKLQRLVVATG